MRQKYPMYIHSPPLPAFAGPGRGAASPELHNKQSTIYQPRGPSNPTWARILTLSSVTFLTLRFLARNGTFIHFFNKHFRSIHVEKKAEKSQSSRGTGILRAQGRKARWEESALPLTYIPYFPMTELGDVNTGLD